MKKVVLFSALFLCSLAVSAFANTIKPGESTQCQDAGSITVAVETIANNPSEKFGYTSNDRGTGNLAVWKSSNATTVPLTLGPNDENISLTATDKGLTGFGPRGENGRNQVVLTKQPEFSRGDSIGDIRGLVRFTNIGTNPVSVKCN